MVVALLKLSRWFPLSKLGIIYLAPNIHSLTRRRLVGHNCKRKRRFWLRRYLLSRLPQIPPCLKHYCVITNADRCWYTSPICVYFSSESRSVCVPSLFRFLCSCLSLSLSFRMGIFVVAVVGVHDEVMLAESVKKEQKNKRKTQKLGWLWEPDRSCERKAGDRRRGSLPGFASVFR